MLDANGSEQAFAGRTFEANGQPMPVGEAVLANPGLVGCGTKLCTMDQQRFLDEPITIVVREGDEVVSTNAVQRVACRLSPDRNVNTEWDQVFVEDDGTIASDFGNDSRTVASCTLSRSFSAACPSPF